MPTVSLGDPWKLPRLRFGLEAVYSTCRASTGKIADRPHPANVRRLAADRSGNRRRCCDSAHPSRARDARYHRLFFRRRSFSARLASAGIGWPSLPGAWAQRHRRHGGGAGGGVSFTGSTSQAPSTVGRWFYARIDATGAASRRGTGGRRHSIVTGQDSR